MPTLLRPTARTTPETNPAPEAELAVARPARRVDPALDAGALRALSFIGNPPADWVLPRTGVDHDVVIVGAGQNGIAIAFNLRRVGVHKVQVIDALEQGRVGVWRSPARMNVLRTPKTATGPELGVPELSFRYWYEARHGAAAFTALGSIRRTDWADYLDWYRELVGVHPRYETRLALIEPKGDHFRLTLEHGGIRSIETSRHVVLATGNVGFGGAYIPEEISSALRRDDYLHTSQDIDFAALRGRSVAVLGGAASAFDVAGTALENGAAEVHLFSRRPAVANHAPGRSRGFPGMSNHFQHLQDADRWWFGLLQKRLGTTAPEEAVKRSAAFANFALHLNSRWSSLRHEDGKIQLYLDGGHALPAFDSSDPGDWILAPTRPGSRSCGQSPPRSRNGRTATRRRPISPTTPWPRHPTSGRATSFWSDGQVRFSYSGANHLDQVPGGSAELAAGPIGDILLLHGLTAFRGSDRQRHRQGAVLLGLRNASRPGAGSHWRRRGSIQPSISTRFGDLNRRDDPQIR